MTKKKAIKKNIQTNIVFFAVNMILNFFSKTIFIYIFGKEILGLNSVLISFLGFLNLVDLGISSSITFKLYLPIVEKNYQKIKDIVDLLENYYKYIGFFVLIIGFLLSGILKRFVNVEINNFLLFSAYFLFVLKNTSTYFLGHKQVLLNADEQQYVVVGTTGKIAIVKIILQVVFGLITNNYLLWLFFELCANITSNLIISYKYTKIYPHIINLPKKKFSEVNKLHKEIFSYVKPMFFHKITSFIVLQTDTLIISYFTNLILAGIYSNYIFLVNSLMALISTFFSALTATIGKTIAENDNNKTLKFYNEMSVVTYYLATIIVFPFFYLVNDFITVWIGKEYLFETNIIFVLSINMFIQISRNPVSSFKQGYGLVQDVWAPITEGIINLSISVLLVNSVGIIGVFIGTLISNIIIIIIWQPYYLATKGFKTSAFSIFKNILKWISISILNIILGYIICDLVFVEKEILNILQFFICGVITFIIILAISTITFCLVEWKILKSYFFNFFKIG